MDNSILYTRCPTCSTAFKVTNEFLAIAGGKVRCGACLAIFQASDYMLEPVKKAEAVEEIPSPEIVKTETSISEFLQQAVVDNQPEPGSVQRSEVKTETELEPEPELESVEELEPNSETDPEPEQESSREPDTEFVQDPEQSKSENQPLFGENFYKEADLEPESDLKDESEQAENIKEPQLTFEEAFDFEDELEEKKVYDIEKPQTNDSELEEKDPEFYESDDFDKNDDLDESFEIEPSDQNHLNEENGLAFDELDSIEVDTDDFGNESELAEQINAQIDDAESEPDPLDEFSDIVEADQSGIRSKIILTSISLLLVVVFFQIWTNRQAIAWNDTWGSMMKTVCNALPCKLKPKRAVNEIKLLQRQFSPHQEKEKTLDVKVLLINQAKFAQPYPVIKIIFSDKNGKEVAVKRFKPSNYLRNRSKKEFMPSNAEVHIQFDTKTPHPDALGFEFIFE